MAYNLLVRFTGNPLLAAAQVADITPPGDLVPNPLDKKFYQAVARLGAQSR